MANSLKISRTSKLLFFSVFLLIVLGITFLINEVNVQAYSSYIDTNEDSFFKVIGLESNISYNFTVSISDYNQLDLGFSIHLDERPKPKNALVIIDNPGQTGETTLFTPEIASDYYIRVYSIYDRGLIEVTVREHIGGMIKVVEPYYPPFDWRWVWVPGIIIGGLIVIFIIIVSVMTFLPNIKMRRVRWPKIEFTVLVDYLKKKRELRRARRIQNQARKKYLEEKRRTLKILAQLKKQNLTPSEREKMKPIPKTDKIIILNDTQKIMRCMVSGLEINFQTEEIVACPICKNIAKKPMMAEWLKVRGTCPICREKILIEHCSKVDYAL